MEGSNEWASFTNKKKYDLFKKYIKNIIENNENNYENGIIDELTYNKNRIILQTLFKDKIRYKNIKNTDITIENDMICQTTIIEKNDDGLIYFVNNKDKKNQTKITDYNYKYRKRNNNDIKIENIKDKLSTNRNLAFIAK
jgi:hypothetical protein